MRESSLQHGIGGVYARYLRVFAGTERHRVVIQVRTRSRWVCGLLLDVRTCSLFLRAAEQRKYTCVFKIISGIILSMVQQNNFMRNFYLSRSSHSQLILVRAVILLRVRNRDVLLAFFQASRRERLRFLSFFSTQIDGKVWMRFGNSFHSRRRRQVLRNPFDFSNRRLRSSQRLHRFEHRYDFNGLGRGV